LCIELNGIDQLADEEETAPTGLIELLGTDRLRNAGGIETGALVGYIDSDGVRSQLGPDIYPLVAVFAVAPKNGIAEGLRQHDPKAEADGLGGFVPRKAVPGDELHRLLDAVDLAGEAQRHQGGGLAGV
jgi:hypothetical protein